MSLIQEMTEAARGAITFLQYVSRASAIPIAGVVRFHSPEVRVPFGDFNLFREPKSLEARILGLEEELLALPKGMAGITPTYLKGKDPRFNESVPGGLKFVVSRFSSNASFVVVCEESFALAKVLATLGLFRIQEADNLNLNHVQLIGPSFKERLIIFRTAGEFIPYAVPFRGEKTPIKWHYQLHRERDYPFGTIIGPNEDDLQIEIFSIFVVTSAGDQLIDCMKRTDRGFVEREIKKNPLITHCCETQVEGKWLRVSTLAKAWQPLEVSAGI